MSNETTSILDFTIYGNFKPSDILKRRVDTSPLTGVAGASVLLYSAYRKPE
jgi:hypothetical protein